MAEKIVNRIANSSLVTIDLSELIPIESVEAFDIQPYLFRGMIVKEKEFRAHLDQIDWSSFTGKNVAVFCSTNAIIPHWSYMLIAVHLEAAGAISYLGSISEVQRMFVLQTIKSINEEQYKDQRVIIKGCGDSRIDQMAYFEITKKLFPVCQSIMYGEACSTVPVYKRKRNANG